LDTFEKLALELIRRGEDLVVADETPATDNVDRFAASVNA